VEDRARIPEAWAEKLDKVLEDEPKPSLKVLHNLLSEGEKIPYFLPGLQDLAAFVQRCDKWLDEANNYITRKQQNRRKNEKAWRKGNSIRAAQMEERDRELRKIEKIHTLLAEAENLSFDCPQVTTLREKVEEIQKFQHDAQAVLCNPHLSSSQDVEELVDLGRNFNVDIPEVDKLEQVLRQMKWNEEARRKRDQYQTLEECRDLIQQGEQLGLSESNDHLVHFKDLLRHGETWEAKAKELMSVEVVHYQQLEALSAQAARFPVSSETLAAVDAILIKQREAQKQISSFYEGSKNPDFRKRPNYKDVRDLMESLAELNSKPNGTIDLEREQKRHEDWMRKGKKLFGKANAPLHILKMHMQYVEKKNSYCFDLEDRCRPPVEPASREASPDAGLDSQTWVGSRSRKKDVFCICRQQEAGLMIECEICHEWLVMAFHKLLRAINTDRLQVSWQMLEDCTRQG
jgi:histone demethylase JARID1